MVPRRMSPGTGAAEGGEEAGRRRRSNRRRDGCRAGTRQDHRRLGRWSLQRGMAGREASRRVRPRERRACPSRAPSPTSGTHDCSCPPTRRAPTLQSTSSSSLGLLVVRHPAPSETEGSAELDVLRRQHELEQLLRAGVALDGLPGACSLVDPSTSISTRLRCRRWRWSPRGRGRRERALAPRSARRPQRRRSARHRSGNDLANLPRDGLAQQSLDLGQHRVGRVLDGHAGQAAGRHDHRGDRDVEVARPRRPSCRAPSRQQLAERRAPGSAAPSGALTPAPTTRAGGSPGMP